MDHELKLILVKINQTKGLKKTGTIESWKASTSYLLRTEEKIYKG